MGGAKIIKALEEAVVRVKAMSPEQYEAMMEKQRQSWARGMAPCEHGVSDWETCADCRAQFSTPQPNVDEGDGK